jgi:glycyl-tRNA synthetase beta subunit
MALQMKLSFSLSRLVTEAAHLVAAQLGRKEVPIEPILEFFRDRLYQSFRDAGLPHDLVEAVMRCGFDDILDVEHRTTALVRLADTDNWRTVVAAVERTAK